MTLIEIKPHRWGWRVFEAEEYALHKGDRDLCLTKAVLAI